MWMKQGIHWIVSIICLTSFLDAQEICRHYPYIGPEVYWLKRTREGGTSQNGWLYGVRGGYDYRHRYTFYFGLEGLYAAGTLNGHSGEGVKLKSHLMDANIEGRLGYTFETKYGCHFSFTPFIGAGYFWENNHYKHPSPLKIHFDNRFYYVPVGFLSQFYLYPNVSIGLNFKARFVIDGHVKASNDPQFDEDLTMHYEEKVQYRVELPYNYYVEWCGWNMGLNMTPFYEYRPYGRRANFPYDFQDTQFRLYGATFKWFVIF